MRDQLHPLVGEWFGERFLAATEPQLRGWPAIRDGGDVLISAPTGSGKTLAAFTLCLDDLVRQATAGTLPDHILAVYVSPLKALTNDVRENLEKPLSAVVELARQHGVEMTTIRSAVRTGDTTPSQRQAMLRTPPHVLVTTPESLFILLTAERSRALFAGVQTVIVDEIHAMAANKRGAHLALTLERLDAIVAAAGARKPQRIGLSATVRPLDEVGRFLSPRATVIDIGHRREMELSVEVPADELGPVASKEMWGEIYDRIAEQIGKHRTTLVFVGTRRMSERVAFALNERLGEGVVMPHHGSLAREMRFDVERRLRSGELRVVVATASLELGIDIGSVDLVVQLGSPRAIAVALQRIGRSGHWVGAMPKGIFYVTTRDELIECAALVRAIRSGALDALTIPKSPLDILAQQIVASCAQHEWDASDLYATVRRAYPYRDLRAQRVRRSRHACSPTASLLRAGEAERSCITIASTTNFGRAAARAWRRSPAAARFPTPRSIRSILEPEGHAIGTLDEDFAVESMAGDIFLLGTNSWRIRRVEAGVVRVEDAHGAPPSVPFWNGEGLGTHHRTFARSLRGARGDRRARRCCGDRMAASRVRAGSRRRRTGRRLRSRGEEDPRCRSHRSHAGRRALFRRRRRHAARVAHAVRCAHQSRVGSGAAQEVLPFVQLGIASGSDR